MKINSLDNMGIIPRPTYAVIDMKRFGSNIDIARNLSKSDIIAVVKADAYGHGAKVLAKYAYEEKNIRNFAVATMIEGIELRKVLSSKDTKIVVLGYVSDSFVKEALQASLTLPVFDYRYAEIISKAAKELDIEAHVALEIDTGMSRLGFSYEIQLLELLKQYKNIHVDFAISHLATSDCDNSYAHIQTERFDKFLEINKGYTFATSFLNSSGIANFENRWTFTRPGLFLYGYESTNVIKDLQPVMSLWSEIAHVKFLKKGESVGYGRTFFAPKDMIIGVIPIGYADGYRRSFSNKGYVLAGNIKCHVIGNVCMDMTMIDVTELGKNCIGQKVQIMGDDITASTLSRWADTIEYEILCGISDRVPRVYKYEEGYFEILDIIHMAGKMSILLYEISKSIFKPPFRFKLFVKQIEFIGYKSIPIIILTGLFTGMVFSLQSFKGLDNFGAGEMTSGLVAMAMIWELAPVLTGIMVAARAGSAMTAELGTMKVTEQIDALDAMAVDPIHYLAVPRMLAGMFSMPLLNAICIIFGIIGSYFVLVGMMGTGSSIFFENMVLYTTLSDIIDSLIKSFVFGLIVVNVSCYNGFNTTTGAEGVGKATNVSVVESSILVCMFDYILTSVLIL